MDEFGVRRIVEGKGMYFKIPEASGELNMLCYGYGLFTKNNLTLYQQSLQKIDYL